MKNNYSYEGKLTTRLRQWWLMLTAVMLLTLTVGLQRSNAQSITNYAFSASSGSFTQIAGTGGSTNISAIQADFGTSSFMPIGFNFLYNGVSYSQFFAHSDGYIGFGATASGTAANNLNTGLTTSRPLLAPYWDDISGAGGVNPSIGTYATTGLPGSRILTVEFLNWRVFWNGPNALSFQVKLYEATGVVEFIYRQEGIPTASTASVGITAAATGAGNFLSLSDVTAAPTVSSATETTAINAIPATNQVYTFTPPVAPSAPTTLTFSAVTNNSMSLDWVDATGEVGYIVERSLDGINYVQVASLPANTITYAAAGLSAGTTYYWNVFSFNEGQKSTALNSNQNTLAGTLCGAYSVGPTGTYASLTAALADIRVNGLTCSVILELQAAYVSTVETFPIWTGNIGTLAGKTVTIRPEAGAVALSITSTHSYATITDSLTSYLFIDGRAGGVGASELTIANSAFTGTSMRIHQESSDNSFEYITFRGVNNTTTNAVVFMGGSTVVGGLGNDNNIFNECDFRDGVSFPNNCFMASGNTSGAVNNNNTISNCRVYNFFSAGAASNGINLIGLNNGWNITGNRIYQEGSRTYTTANIHKGIVANNTAGTFNISNNIIGFANASGTGTYTMTFVTTPVANRFFGMDVNAALSPATTISGNTISNFSIATSSTGTGSGAAFCGIWLNAGGANITNNTVGSMSGVDNILVRGTATGGSSTSANVIGIAQGAASNTPITVTGNNIGGLGFNGITAAFANSATVGATVCGIFNQGFTTLTDPNGTRLISGNTIGGAIAASMRSGAAINAGVTSAANFSVVGIMNTGGTRITISNNSIQNLQVPTRSSAGVVYGIQTSSGLNVITGNTITALSSNAKNVAAATTAHLNGINHTSTSVPVVGTEVNISGNTIHDLKMSADTGRVVVNGIAYTGTTTAGFNQLIQKNLIYDLNDLTTASDTAKHVFIGIGLYGGLPTVQNNMIQVGLGNTSSQDYYGIYKANTNINKIYHNSVYIGGDASVASGILQGNTYGFRRVNRPTTGNDEVINNVFYNARTSALGGLQYAIGLDTNINITSSKNVLFADFANGGRTGIRNLTVASSLTDWRTLTGLDLNSISENPNYIAPAAATPDLHIQPSPAVTPVEGAGLAITGPADDFDSQARAGLTPIDIGADAGDFVASGDFVSPTIISVVASPAGSACVASSRLVSVDASDASGILGVDLNWSLNGVVQTAIVMVFNGGTNLWEGTIPASGSALVSYSTTATDNSVNLNATISASQSYRDEYLFAGLSAGIDQTICPGTSTNLSVASPYLNSIVFSEISGFESGSAGAGVPAPGITGFDYIELTNIGNQPVDISGWQLQITGTTPGIYIIPAGNTVPAGGTFTIARGGGGAAIPGYYVNSTLLSIGSATSQGYIISDLGGNISDVVAINGGTPFNPVGTGTPVVTAAMWSGNVTSSVSTAGIRRTAFSDSNTAADWTVASAGNLTNWGTFNVGLGNIMVANISWSSGGTGSIENVTPVVSPTEYVVTLNDGVCTATDTVNVSWFTTLPAPVGVDSMHCGNQQAKCDIFSVPGATAYRWYTTPTGGTPVQNTIDTNLLVNVATTTTFYVAAFDGVCDGPRVAVTETVIQPDPIDIISALGASICLGEVDTLDVVQTGSTNVYAYTWSGDGVGTLNVNSGPQVISTPVTAGVFTFVVLGDDAAAGCVITDTLVLTVNSNPIVIANLDVVTICAGDSVQLNVSAPEAPTSYLTSNATSTADEEITNVTFGSINNTSTCATTGGPGSTLNLYSNYTALAPAIVSPGQTVPFSVTQFSCGGAFTNRTAIFIDYNRDGDFLDVDENPFLSTASSGNNVRSGNIVIPGTASYGKTRMRVIIVETSGVISSTGTYTWGETEDYTIEIGNANPLSYAWTPTAGLSDPNIANPMATPLVSTLYYITGTDGTTGCSSVDSVDFTVLPVPSAPNANNSAHCGNQIPTASVDPVVGATAYYWYDAAVAGNILQADPSLTFLSLVGTTTTMYVAAFDGSCYSSRTPITVTVATPPQIVASADDSTVCLGSTIALSSTANGYTDFAWSVNGNGNLLTNNTQNVSATPTSADSYNFIVTASGGVGPNAGCATSDTVEVVVYNLPTVLSINIADTTICQGQSTSVIANAVPSSVVMGPQTPPSGYLTSNATSTADEDISNVTFGSLNNSSTCATTGGAGSILNQYSNFTTLPPTEVQAGQSVSYSVTQTSCGGAFTNRTAIFIDYNRDGDFLDVGENPVLSAAVPGNNTASGSVVIPFTASAGVTLMRVINVETSGVINSTGTYTWGETEDYLINISSFDPTLTYSWSPAGDFSNPTAANTTYIGSSAGANVITLSILDTVSGCSNTANRTIYVNAVPAAPVCAGDTICGQGDVTLTAVGSANELFWTEGNGGNILAVNDTLVQNVSASGSFQVREFPNNLDTTAVGYDPILFPSAPAGYFPTTAQGMWFRVDNASGTIIKSVDIYPNGPIGTPYGIEIIDSLGNTIGSASGVTTVTLPNYETIEMNIFVPYSTIPYAMRPTASPNLAVHQNATVSGTSPWVIAGEMTIIAYGNMPPAASYFGATTFGMFYNWQVMHGCFGTSCIADYVVNPAPALSITAGGPTTFCDNGSVSLDASALPTDPSYVNFNWSPATGLSATTGAVVTANVSTTTTYTVTADDGLVGGCANTATITLTVNTAPFATVGVVPDTVCTTSPFQFNGSGGSASFKYVGTTENLGQTAGWPFNGANLGQRMQVAITAAELNAAGIFGPSFINSIGFNVVTKLSSAPYTGFTVDIDTLPTGTSCFSSTNYITMPGGSNVYTGNYSTSGSGWNDIVFSTPYFWDGVHNLVVQTCFANAATTLFDIVYTTQTPGCFTTNALNAAACGAATGTLLDLRPNMRFQGGSVNYAWAPATELDNSAISNPLFTQSLGQGPRQYVLTVTDPSNGCVATDTANFYVSPTPVVPVIEFASVDTTICVSGTMSFTSVTVDGTLQWQSSTDGINFFDVIGENNPTFTSPVITADNYYRLKAYCTDSSYSNIKFVDVFDPTITFSEGDTVCGQGNVTLNATANPGYFVQWFADSLSALPLSNSNSYSTFVTQTDTFWVRATIDTNSVFGGGVAPSYCAVTNAGSACLTNVSFGSMSYSSAACESTSGTNYNIIPEGTATAQVLIGQSYNLSVTCDGSAITSVWIDFNKDGLFDASEWQQVYTTGTNGTISITIPPTALGGKTGMRIRSRLSGNTNGPNDACLAMGSGETEDFVITIGSSACSSVKIPVIAVVTAAPAVTVVPSASTICENSSVTINVTGGLLDYTNFDWAPATGLNVVTGTAVVATPSVSTSYIVTASGNVNGCETSDTAVITVNPAPVFTMSPSSQNLCNGDTAAISLVVTAPVSGNYSVTSIPHTPSAAPLTQSAPALGDEGTQSVALPFTFNFGGVNYTDVTIHANGQILMGANNLSAQFAYTPPTVFDAAAPNNWVGFWGDLNNSVASTITYDIVGSAPSRKLVVKFNAVDFWSADPAVTYQIELNETSNIVDVFLTSVNTISLNVRAVGLETGTAGVAAPGYNAGTWSATNQAFRFAPIQAATIQWSGQGIIGSTTGTSIQAIPSTSGYYYATVTNPLTGCTKIDSVAVNFNVSPAPLIVENDTTLCNPDFIYVHVEDAGAYSGGYPSGTTFTWSAIGVPIADLDSISSSGNGSSYSVIVTLPSGCSATSDTITVLTKSVAVVDVINNATCSGGGSIEVEVTSGIANYNYVWSTDLAQTNIVRNVTLSSNRDTLANLTAGTYYLQVYDEAGTPASCNSGVLTYVVSGSNPIVASVAATNITCFGSSNGNADVTWTGGNAPFSITWSDANFANTTPRSVSVAGNYSVIVSDLSGCADTVAFTIVEPAPVTVTFTSTPESFPGALDGTVTAIPAGGTGPYSVQWADELFVIVGSGNPLTGLGAGLYYGLVTDTNACDNSATVSADSIRVDVASNATLNVKLIIEGYYDGLGGMTPALLNAGVGSSSTEVDTIVVELRDAFSPTTLLHSATVVINTNDSAMITLPGSVIGNDYYIAVFHRNAVQTWSDLPVSFTGVTNYDFTTAATQAFGSNMIEVAPGVFAFYSGDIAPQDEVTDITDQGYVGNDILNFAAGYVPTDVSGDGVVDITDQAIVDNNIINFVGSIHP